MRVRQACGLPALLVLAACQVVVPVVPGPGGGPGTAASGVASAKLPAVASAKPGAPICPSPPCVGPTASASPTGGGARPTQLASLLLQAPTGAYQPLAGTVAIDAPYAVQAGKARLIGQDGATLIGQDGATAVLTGSNLIGQDGATLIGLDGATLIGQDGATLVAAGAGNLIGQRKRDLLALDGGPAGPVGTVLPAAGIELEVRDLETGEVYPLGVDGDGQPVSSVYTNARGQYKVYLPASTKGRPIKVVAAAPGDNQKLVYAATTQAGAGDVALDEDTRLVDLYCREAFASRLVRLFSQGMGPTASVSLTAILLGSDAQNVEGSERVAEALTVALRASVKPGAKRSELRARALATTDAVFAAPEVVGDASYWAPLQAELRADLKAGRERAQARMNAGAFSAAGFLAKANADPDVLQDYADETGQPAEPGHVFFAIERPADISEFLLRYVFMSPIRQRATVIEEVYVASGFTPQEAADKRLALNGVMNGMLLRVASALLNPDGRTLQAAVAAIGRDPASGR